MSHVWRGMSGGIEVLENVNEMADLPDISTIDSEGVWYIESGEFAPDYIAPTNWDATAGEFTDWFSLFDGQIIRAIPDSVVDNFNDAGSDRPGIYESGEDTSDYYAGATDMLLRDGDSIEGSHALFWENDPDGRPIAIVSTPEDETILPSGLNRYPEAGETVGALMRDTGFGAPLLLLLMSDDDDTAGYGFELNADNDRVGIEKGNIDSITDYPNGGGGPFDTRTTLTEDTSVGLNTNDWFWVEIDLPTSEDDSIEYRVYETDGENPPERGDHVHTASANDNDHVGNRGVGVGVNTNNEPNDTCVDWIRVLD